MKIATCMPAHGSTKARFTLSLGSLLVRTMRDGVERDGRRIVPELTLMMATTSDLAWNRNRLFDEALRKDPDYLFCLDVDHVFPDDALLRLLAHRVPVVGINYLRRDTPASPVAVRSAEGRDELVWSTPAKAASTPLERVDRMGLGMCLIAAEALRGLEWPLFDFAAPGTWQQGGGEDYHFFGKLKAAGVPVYIDNVLSLESGHLDERPLTFPR